MRNKWLYRPFLSIGIYLLYLRVLFTRALNISRPVVCYETYLYLRWHCMFECVDILATTRRMNCNKYRRVLQLDNQVVSSSSSSDSNATFTLCPAIVSHTGLELSSGTRQSMQTVSDVHSRRTCSHDPAH